MRYELSEKLFVDVWNEFGSPDTLENLDDIVCFLNELVKRSNGYVVVDHFSCENFDRIDAVERFGSYLRIVWKDFSAYYARNLSGVLSPDELLTWNIFGGFKYIEILLDVEKIIFERRDNHMFLLFRTNLVDRKGVERAYAQHGSVVLLKERNTDSLYTEYIFGNDSKAPSELSNCLVYTLPFYAMLIQPKEGCPSSYFSRLLLINETLKEAYARLERAICLLELCSEKDKDDIESKGNTIRKLMEYVLKFYCAYKNIPIEIEDKYKHITLGDLKKKIPKEELSITQSLINEANSYSHDSGRRTSKKDVIDFAMKVQNLLRQIEKVIAREC